MSQGNLAAITQKKIVSNNNQTINAHINKNSYPIRFRKYQRKNKNRCRK